MGTGSFEVAEMGKAEVVPVDDFLNLYLAFPEKIGTVSPDMNGIEIQA